MADLTQQLAKLIGRCRLIAHQAQLMLHERVINNGEGHEVWPNYKEVITAYWGKIAVLTMCHCLA
jgi:hypothetical protein